jgi:tRNA (guanine-N7-)-methyltransferase
MPNFQSLHVEPLQYPCTQGNTTFLWEAQNGREHLVYTTHNGHSFFIKRVVKGEKILVKGDKITRPSAVSYLQKALQDYQKATKAEAVYSNIYTQKNRHYRPSSLLKDLDFFAKELKDPREIWIEVGFGSGRHLLYQAQKNPNILHIGIEIHKPSIEQVIKRAEAEGLDNIYIVDYDARILMEFLPANKVGRIFVHFPIPWDKKPHRRVISKQFIEEALRVLKVDGTLELRTDSDLYYEYSLNLFTSLSQVRLHVNKNIDAPVSSKYEDRWRKMDKNIYDITLINSLHSKNKMVPKLLAFDKEVLLKKQKNAKELIRGDGWFVHIETWYEIKDGFLLKVALGAYDRPEHRYIIVKDNRASYFPNGIFSTKSNLAAHLALCEWMDG